MFYLLVYDRAAGRLIDQTAFDRRSEALHGRFAAEAIYQDASHNIEVVVVGAASQEDLQRTHGRYFLSAGELAERAAVSARHA